MLSVKKKDLKKKGLGNKPNAIEPLEDHQIEQMWSSGAIGLQNPRSLLLLVSWNNVTRLGMRAFKEQYDCQIEDFTVSEEYVKYTKNAKQRTVKVTKEARGNGRESTTPKYGKPLEEREIHIEPLYNLRSGVFFLGGGGIEEGKRKRGKKNNA